ncbi:MAG: RluA family pseudouridine synthase, partial [Bacteroidota bacterium]
FKTVANALAQNIKPSSLADATIPQPVHRLDYATTGVLLIGKTSGSIRVLNKMFEAKQIEKIYYAVAIGEMNSSGVITTKIDGKRAQSEYTVEETVLSERFDKLNLVQLTPQTGRRHQLRKHLSAIGNPVFGDKDYGTEGLILNGKGLYLHAYSLRFTHPFTSQATYVEDDFPQKFKKIFPQFA